MKHRQFSEALKELLDGNITELVFQTENGEVVRRFCPKERLILLGGGHVALPLAKIGAMLDFEVIVVDDRPAFANTERFSMADKVICDQFEHAVRELELTSQDYVCIITRGHKFDAECLKTILSGAMPFYLGMLGSKGRVRLMKEKLLEEGYEKEALDQVHAPIGLSIHAMTTSEIAVSIAGEMIACRRRMKQKTVGFETDYLPQTNIDRKLIQIAAEEDRNCVIALVIHTEGSTPVKAGAMMAVGPLGALAGTIGGGCKEAEIITLARELLGTGQDRTVTLSLLSELEEEEGMVCGGTMTVYLTDLL